MTDFSVGPPDLIVDVAALIPNGGPSATRSPLGDLLRTGYCLDTTTTTDMHLYRRLDMWSATERSAVPSCTS